MEINQNEERFKDEVKMLEDLRGGINQIYEEMKYMRIALRWKEECYVIDDNIAIVWNKMLLENV